MKYRFEEKKLTAKHYEFPDDPESPRVFISQLMLEEVSDSAQIILKNSIEKIPVTVLNSDEIIFSGNSWGKPSIQLYNLLRQESEYAAWVYVYGFRANHFTVYTNYLKKYSALQDLIIFL